MSCALRIFEAETISSARVTLRMFCVLLILVLISRPLAILLSLAVLAVKSRLRRCKQSMERLLRKLDGEARLRLFPSTIDYLPFTALLPTTGLLVLVQRGLEDTFDLAVPITRRDDLLHQLFVILVHERVQA